MISILATAVVLSSPPLQGLRTPDAATTPSVVTTGHGQLRLPPDVAVLRIGIAARASTAAAAATEAGRRVQAVSDTLRRLGLAPEVTQPVALKVGSNEAIGEARLVDYEALAAMTVRVRDAGRLGPLIDGVLAAGATDIPAVRFESDTADAARRHALRRAFEQAEASARAIAEAAGMRLAGLLEVTTDRDYSFIEEDFLIEDLPYSRGAPSPRRDVPVSAWVTARWRLAARSR